MNFLRFFFMQLKKVAFIDLTVVLKLKLIRKGKMHILIINGGPKKNGMTAKVLKSLEQELQSNNHTTEWIHVYDLEINPCKGCLLCRPDKQCPIKDDSQNLADKIDNANGLVIGSPVYWGNITGPLKTALDRLVPVFEYIDPEVLKIPKAVQKGKKAALVVTSNSPIIYNMLPTQSRTAVQAIKTIFSSGGYKCVGKINIPSSNRRKEVSNRIVRKTRAIAKRF